MIDINLSGELYGTRKQIPEKLKDPHRSAIVPMTSIHGKVAVLGGQVRRGGGPTAARGPPPMGRLGRPEDVAAFTCFLLSEEASFITGSYHLADGGYTAV